MISTISKSSSSYYPESDHVVDAETEELRSKYLTISLAHIESSLDDESSIVTLDSCWIARCLGQSECYKFIDARCKRRR